MEIGKNYKSVLMYNKVLVESLKSISDNDYLKWTSQINIYRALINNLVKDENRKKVLISNLSIVIRDLQFHDIIGQKLDHINFINKLILRNLNEEHMSDLVPYIMSLQIELLNSIDHNYSSSSDSITNALSEIWEDNAIEHEMKLNTGIVFDGRVSFLNRVSKLNSVAKNTAMRGKKKRLNNTKYSEILDEIVSQFTMKEEREIFYDVFSIQRKEENHAEIEMF